MSISGDNYFVYLLVIVRIVAMQLAVGCNPNHNLLPS